MILPVVSTSIANIVSCNEKHRSSGVYSPESKSPCALSSMKERIPEKETSIPFTAYGIFNNFPPLMKKRQNNADTTQQLR